MHYRLTMFPIIAIIFMLCASNGIGIRDNLYNMVNYTPLGSNNTDITEALLEEWSLACKSDTGGNVSVPEGTFLLKKVTFQGPCNGPTNFNVDGILKAPRDASTGEDDYWILFTNVDGLTISGEGTFDGQGENTWNKCKAGSCPTRPVSLKFNDVKNAEVRGISSINSKFFHFHIGKCEHFNVNQVKIDAPSDSPNTDGIHISNSNDVQVNQVQIGTGDDCISLGPGTTNINISYVQCGPGHGISIGSLGQSGNELPVRNVIVSNSSLTSTTNGLRIKTFGSSSPNTVSDVTFYNITVHDVENPIIIDQHYCPHDSCEQKGESQVQISNVKFIKIEGTSASQVSVNLNCSKTAPCKEILLQDLKLSYKSPEVPTTATCSNFEGTFDEKCLQHVRTLLEIRGNYRGHFDL